MVLSTLTKPPFEALLDVSIKWLRMKSLFLLAITLARRMSKICSLSVKGDLCIFHKDKVVLRPDPMFIPKVNSAFHKSQELHLLLFCPKPKYPNEKVWHTLDVKGPKV